MIVSYRAMTHSNDAQCNIGLETVSGSGYGGRVFVIVNVHFLRLTILLTDFEF